MPRRSRGGVAQRGLHWHWARYLGRYSMVVGFDNTPCIRFLGPVVGSVDDTLLRWRGV